LNTKQLGRWRKLYCNPSPSWLALSYSTRGLGYELLRLCDEAGRIECGRTPHFEMVALLAALQPRDRKSARLDFAALIADGFVRVEGTVIVIPNFTEAQEIKSPEAIRKERQRAREGASKVDASSVDGTSKVGRSSSDGTSKVGAQTELNPRADTSGTVTCHGDKRRGEERREEQQQSAREAPAAPVCQTVETATATPPRAPGVALFAALSAGAGDAVRTMVSGDALVRFTALCHELGVDAPTLRVLGKYLRHDRATHPDRFPWRSSRGPHTAVDLGFLTRQEGENLVEFVGKARDWHAARPSEDAVAAARIAQRAAVAAAADTSGALSREETVRRASEARAALAALAPASPARRESGERGAA